MREMSEKVSGITGKLEDFKKEIQEIHKKAHSSEGIIKAEQRLERWQKRLVHYIKKNISLRESLDCDQASESDYITIDRKRGFDDYVSTYIDYLGILIDDIKSNPDHYLSIQPKSKKKEPYSVAFPEDLHSEIYSKCKELYAEGTYAEAAEKGFKVVRDRLRKLTSFETGSDAFGKGKLLILGASAQNVDGDFNEAVKFLTMAIDRFRNEKAHTSDAKIKDPVRAYEYIRLSSLAMHLLENTDIKS